MARVPTDLFDFLDAARKAPTMAQLDDAFSRLIEGWGFDRWTTIPIASPAMAPVQPFEVVFGRPSRTWAAHYRRNNYFPHDAAIRALLRSNESIWWNAFSRSAALTAEERKLFAEAREFGVAEGLSAPLRLANGSVWVCALTGEDSRPNWQVGDAARFAGERYLLRALALRDAALPAGRRLTLTPAQLSILRLLADGLSQKEAAQALSIAPRTVYNQIVAARRRLAVKTVPGLIQKAVKAGLL